MFVPKGPTQGTKTAVEPTTSLAQRSRASAHVLHNGAPQHAVVPQQRTPTGYSMSSHLINLAAPVGLSSSPDSWVLPTSRFTPASSAPLFLQSSLSTGSPVAPSQDALRTDADDRVTWTRSRASSSSPIAPSSGFSPTDVRPSWPAVGQGSGPESFRQVFDVARGPVGRVGVPGRGALQAKLVVGAVDDPLEREADSVADRVMRMADPKITAGSINPRVSRKCASCEEEDVKTLQPMRTDTAPLSAQQPGTGVEHVLRSPGDPLSAATRAFYEPRFGHDFSRIRVHADASAAQSAKGIGARGYTVGSHVVLAGATGAPDALLAHELVHTIQQGATTKLDSAPHARTSANNGQSVQRPDAPPGGHLLPATTRTPTKRFRVPGNQALLRLQRKCACGGAGTSCECEQTKDLPNQTDVKVGPAQDSFEQEADLVAETVMRMPANEPAAATTTNARPKCQTERAGQEYERYTTKSCRSSDTRLREAPPIVQEVLRSPGQPLDPATRAFMEPRFGNDFSRVRVHTDAVAEESARDVNAHAYTVGHNVIFGPGRFAPEAHAGRRLIAHELTHVLQQSGMGGNCVDHCYRPRGQCELSGTATLQRRPADLDEWLWGQAATPKGQTLSPLHPSTHFGQSEDDTDPLYFQSLAPLWKQRVTQSNIIAWTQQYIWEANRDARWIFSLLQRNKTVELDKAWESKLELVVNMILNSNAFAGSLSAKRRFADHLRGSREQIITELDHKAEDSIISEIAAINTSGAVPRGARLVTDPEEVTQVEKNPQEGTLNLGYGLGPAPNTVQVRKGPKGVVRDELGRKRLVSISGDAAYFEVIQHEGIYFYITGVDLRSQSEFTGVVGAEVYNSTKIWVSVMACVGKFFKGAATAVAAPGQLIINAGANAVDLVSLYIAADAKWKLGVDIPHTCLGPVCRQYERCLDDAAKDTDECKRDLAVQALSEAASLAIEIIPIGKSAIQCASGDCEECGATAIVFLPHIVKALEPKTPRLPEVSEPSAGKTAEKPTNISDPELASKFKERAPTATQLRIKEAVKTAAERAGSEVTIGGEKHPLAPVGERHGGGFQLCSECALLADKLAEIEKILPPGSELAKKVSFVRQRAIGYDTAYRKGQLKQSVADLAARTLADDLRNSLMKDPFIDQLLDKNLEDLQKNRQALREQAAKSPTLKRPITQVASAKFIHDRYGESIVGGPLHEKLFEINVGSKLESRIADHYDASGTLHEFNATPWSKLSEKELNSKINFKLQQVAKDITLRADGRIKQAVWYGTEALPTIGKANELRVALKNAKIDYKVVPLPADLQNLRPPVLPSKGGRY